VKIKGIMQPFPHELVSQELMANGCVVKDFVHIDKLKEKTTDILCRELLIRA
jgi:hypothetical protein